MAAPTKKVMWISQFKLSRTELAHLLYGTQTLNCTVTISAAVFVMKLHGHSVWYLMVFLETVSESLKNMQTT
jgi:hypothetical protein